MNAPFYTVFTPSYNRRSLLPRVFESLEKQTCRDFEWIIVDDGSTDDTSAWVEEISRQATFPVRYQYQENAGKHGAHNTVLRLAEGYALVVADSDDWLAPGALESLKSEWDRLDHRESFVGVFGLFAYPDGQVVGDHFPQNRLVSNAIDLRYNLKVDGDKIGFNRTDVLREFPFPDGLKKAYVCESLIWNRISRKYQSLFVNQVIGIKEYQPGGITDNSALNDYRNPEAGFQHALELLDDGPPIPFFATVRTMVRMLKCAFYAHRNPFVTRRWCQRLMMLVLIPLGGAIVARDLFRVLARNHRRVNEGRFVK